MTPGCSATRTDSVEDLEKWEKEEGEMRAYLIAQLLLPPQGRLQSH